MVAPPFLQRPLRNKLKATERYIISRSSWVYIPVVCVVKQESNNDIAIILDILYVFSWRMPNDCMYLMFR